MKLGSLFDGSGGFPLAGVLNGIEPVWASEIEPYPIAVTKSRFPNMIHYGDIRAMNGAELEPVDIISFGSPCTDMSIAGKREGIAAERSGLFFQAIRIIREMRYKTNGEYPKYIIWENVQGAFSSNKGHDFYSVLQEITTTADSRVSIPRPYELKKGLPTAKLKWNKSGEILGDNFSICWRTVDAQYWGVPQRRKRIYLVADFTSGSAREILFKQESLRRDMQESNEQREENTSDVIRGIDGSVGAGVETPITDNILAMATAQANAEKMINCSPTVTAAAGMGGNMQPIITAELGAMSRVGGHVDENISSTLRATPGDNQTSVCYSLQANSIDRADTAGCNGKGWSDENVSYTLNTVDKHCVAYTVGNGQPDGTGLHIKAGTLNCMHDQQAVLFENHSQDSRYIGPLDTAPKISAKYGTGGNNTPYVQHLFDWHSQSHTVKGPVETAPTVMAAYGMGGGTKPFIVSRKYIIRRLTPTECARLQGFPDWWGHLNPITEDDAEFWTAVYKADKLFNSKPYKPFKTFERLSRWHSKLHSDSNEYKMWGNGICLWNAEYIMRNIKEANR